MGLDQKRKISLRDRFVNILPLLLFILYLILVLSLPIFTTLLENGHLDHYTPEKAVVVSKFIWDTDEHETYTNGQDIIITGDPPEYNIKLDDGKGSSSWFEVTEEEYSNTKIGDFLNVYDYNPFHSEYHCIVLYKGADVLDDESHGKLSLCVSK